MNKKKLMVLGADETIKSFFYSIPDLEIIYVSEIKNALFEFIYNEFNFDEIIIFGQLLWVAESQMKK